MSPTNDYGGVAKAARFQPKRSVTTLTNGINTESRYDLWPRKNRRHAKKRLLAFVVIWQIRQCVVHQSSLSKQCERRTTSFWQQLLPSLTPPFAQRQKMGNGLRLMFWRMFVPLRPSTN